MLEGMPAYRGGIDGLKTGTTDKAGASFVGTTVEKGMRIITVVLNADQQDGNPYARFTATSSLLDYISANFTLQTVVKKVKLTKIVRLLSLMEKKTACLQLLNQILLLSNELEAELHQLFNSHQNQHQKLLLWKKERLSVP